VLTDVGRMKYLKPLSKALMRHPETAKLAKEIYADVQESYHPLSRGAVAGILTVRQLQRIQTLRWRKCYNLGCKVKDEEPIPPSIIRECVSEISAESVSPSRRHAVQECLARTTLSLHQQSSLKPVTRLSRSHHAVGILQDGVSSRDPGIGSVP